MGPISNGGTRVQGTGVWGTWVIGAQGVWVQGVWATLAMGHMGNGVQEYG